MALHMDTPVRYNQLSLFLQRMSVIKIHILSSQNTMTPGGNVLFLVPSSIANLEANILLCINHAFNFRIIQLPFGKIKCTPSNNANMLHLNKHKSLPKLFKNSLKEISVMDDREHIHF